MTKQLQKVKPMDRMKLVTSSDSVKEQFTNALKEKSSMFVASIIDLYASDTFLQNCEPGLVVMECLKAATLDLPINKSLGFAYVIPYKKQGAYIPQFQLGYKGMIQLAMRTGKYRFINAGSVYEGELKGVNKLTGECDLFGARVSDKVVGFFSYIETINGFKKTMYSTIEEMEAHGLKYSKSYASKSAPWKTEFDAMARKTMLRKILSGYGLMSVDMAEGLVEVPTGDVQEYAEQANEELIDIDTDTGEIHAPDEKEEKEKPGCGF